MFIHKCVRSTRVFTNRLLNGLRKANNGVVISRDIKQDLLWFIKFIPKFNGTASYVHPQPTDAHTIAIDASLEKIGGVWGNLVYSCKIPDFVKENNATICHFEMINILIALKVWKHQWAGRHIQFFVDNMAVVQIMNSGYTKDIRLGAYARNIWLLTSCYDITISVKHIAGKKNNIADLLSRWSDNQVDLDRLYKLVDQPKWCEVLDEYFEIDMEI